MVGVTWTGVGWAAPLHTKARTHSPPLTPTHPHSSPLTGRDGSLAFDSSVAVLRGQQGWQDGLHRPALARLHAGRVPVLAGSLDAMGPLSISPLVPPRLDPAPHAGLKAALLYKL